MADELIGRPAERQTAGRLADGQAGVVRSRASRWVGRQTGGQVDRQAGLQMSEQSGEQMGEQTGKQAGGQAGRRTGNRVARFHQGKFSF
jgi:hypothetical protein